MRKLITFILLGCLVASSDAKVTTSSSDKKTSPQATAPKLCDSKDGYVMSSDNKATNPELQAAIIQAAKTAAGADYSCPNPKIETQKTCYKVASTSVVGNSKTVTYNFQFQGKVQTKCLNGKKTTTKNYDFSGTATKVQTCTVCGANFFETSACSPFKSNTCQACKPSCPVDYFIERQCGGTKDIGCEACSQPSCTTTQFSTPCDGTGTKNRSCQNCRISCDAGQFISAACSATKDMSCSTCAALTSANCTEGVTFFDPCGVDHDARCLSCDATKTADDCVDGETYFEACSKQNDNQCTACGATTADDCVEGEFFEACSKQNDARCSSCSTLTPSDCSPGLTFFESCSIDHDARCSTCTVPTCADGETLVPCTVDGDNAYCQPAP